MDGRHRYWFSRSHPSSARRYRAARRPCNAPRFGHPQKRDRIYADYASAWRARISCGFVANMRFGRAGMNRREPSSDQVFVKVCRFVEDYKEYRHVFARPKAYTGGFAPRLITPLSVARLYRRCRFRHYSDAPVAATSRRLRVLGWS